MNMKLFRSTLVCLLGFSLGIPAHAERVRHYDFLTVGKPSGSQVVTERDDGITVVDFEFNDRGRGPNTKTVVQFSPDGLPVRMEITGNNYLKGEVNEQFDIRDGEATWSSSIEQGSASVDGDSFYVANNEPPIMFGRMVKAALENGGQLKLLPSGQANVEALVKRDVQVAGVEYSITLYSVTGLDASPLHVWLDEDNEFFGSDFGWFAVAPTGVDESVINTMKDAQEAATDEFFRGLTARLTTDVEELLVFDNARVFDSLKGEMMPAQDVYIWKGKISAIFPAEHPLPEGVKVIEADGMTLLPTLWDMHGHVSIESYFNYLAAGVTNVRDMANDTDVIFKLVDDVEEGVLAGPDIYALGFIDKRGQFSAPTGRLADNVDEAIELVDYYAAHGFHGIKLYSSIEPEWVEPIASYAHERNLSVKGHVPAYMNSTQAIHAGYDEITHINMILLNFLSAEELDTRTPVRFVVPGEKSGDLDLGSAEVIEFLQLMKERDIALDPTLSIFLDMFLNEPGEIAPTFQVVADKLPTNVRRHTINGKGYNDFNKAAFAEAATKTQELLKLMHETGIRILPGTDAMLPGFALISELANYVEAGIAPGEVLQLATIGAARHLGQSERLGSVTIGKDAHVHLVRGNPLEDMHDLLQVEYVVKGRQLFHAPSLLEAQGFGRF